MENTRCKHCGRQISLKRQRKKAKYCCELCKNRYWSRDHRRFRKLEKRVEVLENELKRMKMEEILRDYKKEG